MCLLLEPGVSVGWLRVGAGAGLEAIAMKAVAFIPRRRAPEHGGGP